MRKARLSGECACDWLFPSAELPAHGASIGELWEGIRKLSSAACDIRNDCECGKMESVMRAFYPLKKARVLYGTEKERS